MAARLAFLYGAIFLVIGIMLPFWPVWLEARGLNAVEIGYVMAAGAVVRIFANPYIASLSDRYGARRTPLIVLAIASVVFFIPFQWLHGFWPLFLLQACFLGAWTAIMPVGESITMAAQKEGGVDYGRVRLWGSFTFILGASGLGYFLKDASADTIYLVVLAALFLTVTATLCIPNVPTHDAPKNAAPLTDVLRDKRFILFLCAAGSVQASHAVYYNFATLDWLGRGLDAFTIGSLWAEGVLAEIILFFVGAFVLRRFGPLGLIGLGAIAGILRWGVMATDPGLTVTVALQLLHAFTFGAAHLGAVQFIADNVPANRAVSAQMLYALCVSGIALGGASVASGYLYETFAAGAYLGMAALCALGAILTGYLSMSHRHQVFTENKSTIAHN